MSDSGEAVRGCETNLKKSNSCRRRRDVDLTEMGSLCSFPAKKRSNFDECNNESNLSISDVSPPSGYYGCSLDRGKKISEKSVEIPRTSSDADISGSMNCESHGSTSVIGRRRAMEDALTVVPGVLGGVYDFFAVYDVHGGAKVANSCRDRMRQLVAEEVEKAGSFGGDEKGIDYWEKVMKRCFRKMDEEVCREAVKAEEELSEKTVSSTALVVLVGKEEIVVANCGDSRAVLCRRGVALAPTTDHKPDRADEFQRIKAAGGEVIDSNSSRVLDVLGISRSIGDQYLKPYVTAEPEVTVTERKEWDEFIVIATDGLWDVISNEFACEIVKCYCGQSKNCQQTLREVVLQKQRLC